MWTMIMLSNHVVIRFKCWLQICTNMNDLKFDFSKKVSGRGSPSPLPGPLPRPLPFLLSGFALCLGFAPNSYARSALNSGFIALDSRALRTLDSDIVLNFRLGNSVGPPK